MLSARVQPQEFNTVMLKIVLKIARAIVVLAVPVAIFIFTGGYWENLPLLNRVSGSKHFTNYVCPSIPSLIYEVQGGYSGFPQGFIGTRFRYKEGFNPDVCLIEGWVPINPNELDLGGVPLPSLKVLSRSFVFGSKSSEIHGGLKWSRYLLLDDKNLVGYLYIP